MRAPKIIVDPALEKLGPVLVQALKNNLEDNGSVDTGALINSINYYVKDNVLVITYDDYGDYVDSGTRGTETGLPNRKMPPITAIQGWATRHGMNPWVVAKNIQKWGTEPRPWLNPLTEFERTYFDLLEGSLFIEIDEFIESTFKDLNAKITNR